MPGYHLGLPEARRLRYEWTCPMATPRPMTLFARIIPRRGSWVDLLVILFVGFLIYGLVNVAAQWRAPLRAAVEIDLSVAALPRYTFFSLCRGLAAFILSFGFTLVYGYIAARVRHADKVMLPLLDILQSIPVLGFMPGVVLALAAMFPTTNVGLELAAVVMIFTGQAWNMTAVPPPLAPAPRRARPSAMQPLAVNARSR